MSGVVRVSDKLSSHDASPCLRTLVKALRDGGKDKERVAEDGSGGGGGGAVWTSEGRERDRRRVMEETGVTVTTGRWREIEGDWEVVGLCFCSLTAWQSSLD